LNNPITIESLDALREQLSKVSAERDEYAQLARLLREENERLKRGLVGQKRERFVPSEQLALEVLATALSASEQPLPKKPHPIKAHTRKPPTGRKIPEHLPRMAFEVLPDEVQRLGTDAFERIGEEVSEVVERRVGGLVVVQTVRGKYVLKERAKDAPTTVHIAESSELPIERGMAGPGLLAETIVARWQEHMPANRLEGRFAREGMEIARSTLCEWHIKLSTLCTPLLTAMWQDALAQEVLYTDATGVLVQAPKECRKAHFFVVVAPQRHVLFRFTSKHNSEAVDGILKDYAGYRVADAHTIYDHLYRSDDPAKHPAVECGCWAHCRRYFFKSLPTDPKRATGGLDLIKRLFELERQWKDLAPDRRRVARGEHSTAVADRFFEWADAESLRVLPETPIHAALTYARNQRTALRRFLDDGRIPIHNNESERQLRREVVGRKNWLFVGSDDGAVANATFVSLLASCQLHGIEPAGYLRDLFCLLPSWPTPKVLDLAPANWRTTNAREDVQRVLGANPFRRVCLGFPPAL
jgi:transposase